MLSCLDVRHGLPVNIIAGEEQMSENANQALNEELKVDPKTLLGQWRKKAYDQNADKGTLRRFWNDYFEIEKRIYALLLEEPDTVVKGTVKELADKFNVALDVMVGFLDGINDSLVERNPIETMDENTEVNLGFDKERLYKNMVDAKADWLYELPEWDAIFRALYGAEKVRNDRKAEESRQERSLPVRLRQEV